MDTRVWVLAIGKSASQAVVRFVITSAVVSLSLTSVSHANNRSFSEPILPLEQQFQLNPLEVKLGKKLFHDPRLSADNSTSCASCHVIAEGGDDDLPVSVGIHGRIGSINAPTVINSGLSFAQFWDGRAQTLEEQASGPITNPLEMDSSWPEVISKLNDDASFRTEYFKIYQSDVAPEGITKALAAYQRGLISTDGPFDRYLKGDHTAISDEAKEGYALFKNMGCVACHQGQAVGGNMFQVFGVVGNYFEDRGDVKEINLGRFNVTGNYDDKYRFKVPSLRNVAETAPYFHDGSAATLKDAIQIMARYQLGRPISDDQIIKIEYFLKTLSGNVPEDLK